jgi:hypothetical protein
LNYTVRHDPPLIYDVDVDPSESYNIPYNEMNNSLLNMIIEQKKSLTFRANSIDPRFGMKWALCCDTKTNCTCTTPTVIRNTPQ